MKLLLYPAVDNDRLVAIQRAAGAMAVVNAANAQEAGDQIGDADAFFGKLTGELLSAARQLRWVQAPTASLEHYLFPELIAHGCQLTNMRGLFSDVIADHVLGLVICFARHLHTYIRQQMERRWAPVGGEAARSNFVSGPGAVSAMDLAHRQLADMTMGIVGFGAIGQETARRAQAFGMRVIAVDVQRGQRVSGLDWLGPAEQLPQLLAESDFVVIAAPHTPQTEKLFTRRQFQMMRRSAVLINIGRGAIVDLADLTASLRAGEIAGAGLDVFEIEPLPAEHPLWSMPNVILTPHVAGAGPRIAERHLHVLTENIRRFVHGEALLNVVDKRQWF